MAQVGLLLPFRSGRYEVRRSYYNEPSGWILCLYVYKKLHACRKAHICHMIF